MVPIEYWGIVFDARTVMKLMRKFQQHIPDGWTVWAHHVTLTHVSDEREDVQDELDLRLGEHVPVRLVSLGISDEAVALGVTVSGVPCLRALPHLTLATAPGVGAVKSNAITRWVPLSKQANVADGLIKGAITAVPYET